MYAARIAISAVSRVSGMGVMIGVMKFPALLKETFPLKNKNNSFLKKNFFSKGR
jgi:hypothetical protein